MKITAIIVINRNPKYLTECIKSFIDEVDEVIIGDVGMTAQLPESVTKKRAKIVKLDPKTPFADLVKEDLKKYATGDYILYIDPDEIMPAKLWIELKENMKDYDCFYIPRKNFIFGKWIAHSRWWPDYQLRFFKKDNVIWPKIVHPTPQSTGSSYKVPDNEDLAIIHHNYESIDEFLEKMKRYATHEAKLMIINKESYSFAQALQKGLHEFISRYFAHDGYKDGMHGAVLSLFQMFYYLLVYFYVWEKKGYEAQDDSHNSRSLRTFFYNALFETNHWMSVKKLARRTLRIRYKLLNRLLTLLR